MILGKYKQLKDYIKTYYFIKFEEEAGSITEQN